MSGASVGETGVRLGRSDGGGRVGRGGGGVGGRWQGTSLGICPPSSSLLAIEWGLANIPEGIL